MEFMGKLGLGFVFFSVMAVKHPVSPTVPVGARAVVARLGLICEPIPIALHDFFGIEAFKIGERINWNPMIHGRGLLGFAPRCNRISLSAAIQLLYSARAAGPARFAASYIGGIP